MHPTRKLRLLWQIFHYVLSFRFHQTEIKNKILTLYCFQITNQKLYTYNNIIVTPIASTTRRTLPVLIPDMSAIRHIIALQSLAIFFKGTSFRDVKLFLGSLRPIWCTYNHQTLSEVCSFYNKLSFYTVHLSSFSLR